MFSSYPSIENKADKVSGDQEGDIWAATPKYHGTNTSVWVPTDPSLELAYGRRNALLKEGEAHYGYETLLPTLADWSRLRDAFPHRDDIEALVVYGELYGGNYPHPEVEKTSAKAVQPQVYYSPHLRFVAYDLCLKLKDGSKAFVDLYDALFIFRHCGIPHVTLPFRGPRKDAIEWAKLHATDNPLSWMPPYHSDSSLPPLEGNMGEGFVVRPVVERLDRLGGRCMLKVKSPKFAEVKNVVKKAPTPLGERSGSETVATYLNDARCMAVCSKFLESEVDIKNMKVLGSALVEDALKDVPSDDPVHDYKTTEAKTFRTSGFKIMSSYLRSL